MDATMRSRVARQRGFIQQQLDTRKVPKWCEWSGSERCKLCDTMIKANQMVVKVYLSDAPKVPTHWVHVWCAQHLITSGGFKMKLTWRKEADNERGAPG